MNLQVELEEEAHKHLLMKLSLRDSDHCHVLSFRSCPCRSSFVP
ncbi:hypothetical protein GYH30_018693 [Glycine max]|nr:hypothetical protein GYH30_018693 [Glycine max]